jgi:hypothetical protein
MHFLKEQGFPFFLSILQVAHLTVTRYEVHNRKGMKNTQHEDLGSIMDWALKLTPSRICHYQNILPLYLATYS